jgi:phosphatidylethanolamine/phosphatidyl-N-methylethanolamine N-methyltransferase
MDKLITQIKSKSEQLFTFLHALLKNPRGIGAFCPSSTYLAHEMVRHVQIKPNEIALELGPGTGVITQALLNQEYPSQQIIAIEYSDVFAKKLQTRFPQIKVIQGDAVELDKLIDPTMQVTYIISSLPLRSLPLETSKAILAQIAKILPPGGRYIQFTYGYNHSTFGQLTTFKHVHNKRVWLNFPPARVDIWEKT